MPDPTESAEPGFAVALQDLTLPSRHAEAAVVDNLQRALASAGRGPPAAGEVFAQRYRLERVLGQGGMGIVWLAQDDELKRPVAIKMLTATETWTGLARLRREARAVAQLAHPNVAAIYDVDTDARPPFIVMEYVPGGDLGRWLKQDPRPSWDAVLCAFDAAGQALAAAHGAGLVHRDFKPANVVGAGGRIRVVDFGLARGGGNTSPTPVSAQATAHDATVTRTGVGLGTPAYMAPEQHDGGEVTASADVFAFACSLYEGLYGARPYQGTTMTAVAEAKRHGPPSLPPSSRVPARLYPIIARGLAPDPTARWPTMQAFLSALRRAQRTRRSAWLLVSTAGIAVAAAGWTAVKAPPACQANVDAFERESARHQSAVLTALEGTAATPALRQAVQQTIDGFATDWVAAATAVCQDDENHGLPEATMACLTTLRTTADAQWDRATRSPEAALQFALHLDHGVSIKECGPEAIRGMDPQPPDPEVRREIAALQAWARAVEMTPDADQDESIAQRLQQAERTSHRPTVAAVQVAAAELAHRHGDTESALQWCDSAFATATAGGADWLAFEAAMACSSACNMLGRVDEARRWHGRLTAAAERLEIDPVEHLRARAFLASALARAGELDEARRVALEVDTDFERAPHHTRAALDSIAEIGMVALWLDDMALAVDRLERGYASVVQYRPEDDPMMASFEGRLATAYRYVGRYTEAEALFERTLAHPLPAQQRLLTELNYAQMLADQPGRTDDAYARLDRAQAVLEAEDRAGTVDEAALLSARGQVHVKAERWDEAKTVLLRARAIYLNSLDPQNIQVQNVDDWLARVQAHASDAG